MPLSEEEINECKSSIFFDSPDNITNLLSASERGKPLR